MKRYLICAAGGNVTVIETLGCSLLPEQRIKLGARLLAGTENFGVEQAGFWLPKSNRLEMAGGEFCGNASRAAAIMATNFQTGTAQLSVSGFDGEIMAQVKRISEEKFFVSANFPDMKYKVSDAETEGKLIKIVDLDGIVHVVINGNLPENYEEFQRNLTKKLGLENRAAVGVIWYQKKANAVKISPVVWVRKIDSFFRETSCGSGSIAVAIAAGVRKIVQPTGKIITVDIKNGVIILESEMEVIK
jgi:diaminopimelate epimerase